MAGSTFGNIFSITTWGESHGKGIGVVIDGCPAGLSLTEEDIQVYLNRRKPGQSRFTTPRKEDDTVEILSGVFDGRTTGTPISLMVRNTSQRSKDYSEIASYYRPGHADYTYDCKYGFRDYTGGGRSSGRETIGRVAAGAVAAKLLQELGITVTAYTRSIGPVQINDSRFDLSEMERNAVNMPDAEAAEQAMAYLDACRTKEDSCGGVVECVVKGVPAGVGDPCFDKLSANLAKAICSIGAVKGFEIGDGFLAARSCGSENNDAFYMKDLSARKPTMPVVSWAASVTEATLSSGQPSNQRHPSALCSIRSTNPGKTLKSLSMAATIPSSCPAQWWLSNAWLLSRFWTG